MWAMWPDWVWWPLYSTLAIIEARQGKVGAAEAWATKVPLPPPLDLVVKAYIELAAGRPTVARSLADRVLRDPQAVVRWRLLAVGIALSVPDVKAPNERDILLGSTDWTEALDTVMLLPSAAKELVSDSHTQPSNTSGTPRRRTGAPASAHPAWQDGAPVLEEQRRPPREVRGLAPSLQEGMSRGRR